MEFIESNILEKQQIELQLQLIQKELEFITQIEAIQIHLENSLVINERGIQQQLAFYQNKHNIQLIESQINQLVLDSETLLNSLELIINYCQINIEDENILRYKQLFIQNFLDRISKIQLNFDNQSYMHIQQKFIDFSKLVGFDQKIHIFTIILAHQQVSLDALYKMFILDSQINKDYDILFNYLQIIINFNHNSEQFKQEFLNFFYEYIIQIQYQKNILKTEKNQFDFENIISYIECVFEFQQKNQIEWMSNLLDGPIIDEILNFEAQFINQKTKDSKYLEDKVKTFSILYGKLFKKYQNIKDSLKNKVSKKYSIILKLFLNFIYEEFQENFNQQPVEMITKFYNINLALKQYLKSLKNQEEQIQILKKFKNEHILSEFEIINEQIINNFKQECLLQTDVLLIEEIMIFTIDKIKKIKEKLQNEKLKRLFFKQFIITFTKQFEKDNKIQKIPQLYILKQMLFQIASETLDKGSFEEFYQSK